MKERAGQRVVAFLFACLLTVTTPASIYAPVLASEDVTNENTAESIVESAAQESTASAAEAAPADTEQAERAESTAESTASESKPQDTKEAAPTATPVPAQEEINSTAENTAEEKTEVPAKEPQTAFEKTASVSGVAITVKADAGAFPADARLSVTKISRSEQKKVDAALDDTRGENASVKESYTFDIKVLDANGAEIQPAEGKSVTVSFKHAQVKSEETATNVYHLKEENNALTAEALSVETNGDTATVTTDGFSYYTVEFTYGDKQYVLDGGGVIKLDDLLKEIGIEGNVKGVSVSKPELFNMIWGTKDGVKYITTFEKGKVTERPTNNPKGTVRYIASFQPFDSQEWMDVTMTDGSEYHIIVTDAITNKGGDTDVISGVAQGINPTFPSDIPVGDIWIDETIVNNSPASRNSATFIPGELMTSGNHPGFVVDTSGAGGGPGKAGYEGNHFIVFDTYLESLDGKKDTKTNGGVDTVQSCNEFTGVLGTYKWPNAAVGPDGELYDVYVEYSNPMITIQTPTGATTPNTITDAYLGLMGGNVMTVGAQMKDGSPLDGIRYGLQMTIRPYVTKHTDSPTQIGTPVSGNFYYPMTDIDVYRNGSEGSNYSFFYGGNPALANYEEKYNGYSETIVLNQGLIQNSNGDKVYIPGASGDQLYVPKLQYNNGEYTFSGTGGTGSDGTYSYANNNFYTGFMSLVENGSFSLTYRGSSASGMVSGMETYILCGTPNENFNYRLRHSTETLGSAKNPNPAGDDGGDIATTREGNSNGRLDDGQVIPPSTIATSTGQSVTYTFIPKDGYGIRELWLWDDQHYTYESAPAGKRETYEWANGTDRYRYLTKFGEVGTQTQTASGATWTYDGYVYSYNGSGWDRTITYSAASNRDRVTHNWTETESGDTYTYKYEDNEWHKYKNDETEFEPVAEPPATASYSETNGPQPPADATSPSGIGEWHLFKYYNQTDTSDRTNHVWTDGDYTYRYDNSQWISSIRYEDTLTSERTNKDWYVDVTEGGTTTTYVYKYENNKWQKFDTSDPSKEPTEEDPPAYAVSNETVTAPPDSAVTDRGQDTPPNNATNAFPTTDTMRQGAGYRIYEGNGSNNTYVAHDNDGDGEIDRYTFTFENIHNNHAIHVVWGQTILEIRKQVTGNNVEADTFTFHIKAWGDDNHDGVTDYIDFTQAGNFNPSLVGRFAQAKDGEGNPITGTYSFTMTNNTTLPIPPELIPVGYEWQVTEVKADGSKYGTLEGWDVVGSNIKQGQFVTEDESAQANFLNRRDKVIDPKNKLTVKKIWENDNTNIRPQNINMTIEKPAAIGIDGQRLKSNLSALGGTSSVTAFKAATKEEYEAAASTRTIQASKGSGNMHVWKSGNEIYYYSESQIYLTGSAVQLFKGYTNLTNISGLADLRTDFVEDMTEMFNNCKALNDLTPLKDWNTANVTDMKKMFCQDSYNNNPGQIGDLSPIANWKVQNVTNMRRMFMGQPITTITGLDQWDVSRVENFEGMFQRGNKTQALFNDTNGPTSKTIFETWNVGAACKSGNNNDGTTPFRGIFSGKEIVRKYLPDWSQEPSRRYGNWINLTTYGDAGGYYELNSQDGGPRPSTTPTNKNDEDDFWDNTNKAESQTLNSYKEDPTDKDVWIYEFEVPADDAAWNVYETVPGRYTSYYDTSASVPIKDDDANYQKWVYGDKKYDSETAAQAAALAEVTSEDGQWIYNGTSYSTQEEAEDAAKATVYSTIIATDYNVGKGVKANQVREAKAATTTTIKNVRKNYEFKVKKDATAAGIQSARNDAKDTYMSELAAAETDPTRKAKLENGDESVLTTEETEELQNRQKAACTFTFTLKLWCDSESVPYNIRDDRLPIGVTKKGDGLYEFKMIPDPDVTETFSLPAGIHYRVEEVSSAGWHLTTSSGTTGLLNENHKEAFFLNTRTDVINVVKKWDDDSYAGAVMGTRPMGDTDSLGIVLTTVDSGTRWKVNGSVIDIYNADSDHFSNVVAEFNASTLTPSSVRDKDNESVIYSTTEPKYVKLTSAIGTKIAAGDYVIDRINNNYYKVIPVINIPFEKEYTRADNVLEDDGANTWLYQYSIPSTEKVIGVSESSVPGYYQKLETTTDADGRLTYVIDNTIDKRNLRVEKKTPDNEEGMFNFAVKFYVETTTSQRHPVKVGHTQILTKQDGGEQAETTMDYEIVLEDGVTYNNKNVAGIHVMRDGTFTSTPASGKASDKLTQTEAEEILNVLKTIQVNGTDSPFTRHHSTNLSLASLGLKWNEKSNEGIYVEQDGDVAQNMFTNGRRLDWFIIPNPGEGEAINIKAPYTLRTAQETVDGVVHPKQLPANVLGSNGTYFFSLHNGDHITFNELPVGVSYEIVEYTKEGWKLVSKVNEKGTLTDGATEKWTYKGTEYSTYAAAEAAVYQGVKEGTNNRYNISDIEFTTKDDAEAAAMDAIVDNGDGTFSCAGVSYTSFADAQTAAKNAVSASAPFKVNGNIYTTEIAAKRAAVKAIGKKAYDPLKAVFTNEREKGNIKIEKETILNDPGKFRFRAKIWDIEDVTEVKAIARTGSGTEEEIKELLAAIANLNLQASHTHHQGIIDYVEKYELTTDQEAVVLREDTNGLQLRIGEGTNAHVYLIGTLGFVESYGDDVDAAFEADVKALGGNTQFYILKDNSAIGALSAEFTANKEHYMVLTDHNTPAVTPVSGEEGVYEFTLEVDANNTAAKRTKLLTDIPYGYRYEIRELTPTGWELVDLVTDFDGNGIANGTLYTTGTLTYTFTNGRATVPLTIGKTVTGNQGSRDKYFKYKIDIENAGNGRTIHLDMENATRAFETGADLTKAPNAATKYTRGEILNGTGTEGGNKRDDDLETLTYENATEEQKLECEWQWTDDKETTDESDDVTYVYKWDASEGAWTQKDKATGQSVTDPVEPPDEAKRTGAHGQHIICDEDGKATIYIYLQHGETAKLRDIPVGSKYTVIEYPEDYKPSTAITGPTKIEGGETIIDADTRIGEAWDTDMTITKGTEDIATGEKRPLYDGKHVTDSFIRKATEITFTNTMDGVVPTEIFFNWQTWVLLLAAAATYFGWRTYRRRSQDV